MTQRHFLFGFAAVLAALITAACGDAAGKRYPDYRYRLTVEVDTPEGIKTGSSVIEVSTRKAGEYEIPTPKQVFTRIKGEAVAVDLGKRGIMFALLRSEYNVDWAAGALWSVTKPVTYEEAKAAGLRSDYSPSFDMGMQRTLALTGRHDLPRYVDNAVTRGASRNSGGELPSAYPMLVTFKDVQNPASAVKLNADNLAETFGAGVELKRITVERTEDAVTTGLEKRLPWLPALRGSIVKYPSLTPIRDIPLEHRINDGDFTQGILQ